ncbi:MAG: COX15/CtaA family protein [Planctomycetaceae bacterium]
MHGSPNTVDPPPARWLHRWAVLIVCFVWPLIWVGGLVTTYDAGMAVPDWPGTYGKNLFLYPYQTWLLGPFDLFIEHGHRLLGAVVGFFAIIAVTVAFLAEPRRWVRFLAVILLLAVTAQGILGGIRVVLSDRTFAMIHGCTAPLVFVISTGLAVVTSRWWWRRSDQNALRIPSPGSLRLAIAATLLAYVQLLLGAQLRHVQAISPPGGFAHLVYAHISGAVLLWGVTFWLAWTLRRGDKRPELADSETESSRGCGDLTLLRPGWLLVGLVGLQIAMGLGTWVVNYGWPRFAQVGPTSAGYVVKSKAFTESIITTAHVATGSLILAVGALLWLRIGRTRFRPRTTADTERSSQDAAGA